ncbi:transmembrane protein [Cupriavidus basilensis OR16]|uniref:Transmembrane protein n=1 Tax=Cupriavidus basilensis OR16 TaxID=1127483 RepID=H1RZ59_9BURK|nr:DUF3025 domain-containing protein [Cupriavidus basilensis]EHP44432.1 transmembrane protein [Cupriavidus basilensis OR16]
MQAESHVRLALAGAVAQIDWAQPWFRPFATIGTALAGALRGGADLRAVLSEMAAQRRLRNARGVPLRFVAQAELPAGTAYEAHIHATGAVPTRDNLHDFFNALIWLHFPRSKRVLNRLQARAIAAAGVQGRRGSLRDAATLFDENAILFLSADSGLESVLRGFGWEHLFLARRDAWDGSEHAGSGDGTAGCGVVPFGHALLEKLVRPYKALTAHAWPLAVPPAAGAALPGSLDDAVCASLEAAELHSARFAPLPVLGIPGWCEGNRDPAYYADTAVFRRGRRAQPA